MEGLKSYHVSNRRYRNRRIGDFLKELHLTEGRNTGFKKILDALEANGSPKPEFETDDERSYFITRLFVHEGFARRDGKMNELIFVSFKTSVDVFRLVQRNYFYNKLKEAREMTLGEYVFLLDKYTHPSHPLAELKRSIQENIKQNNILLGDAVSILRNFNENVRRLSAHSTVMSYDELVETRQKLFGIGHANLFYVLHDRR